ncbi:MAG: HEPN domain-containing protein [Nitrososphaerota archaeon]
MEIRNEALRWLEEAEKDFETAEILYRNARYNAACSTRTKQPRKP